MGIKITIELDGFKTEFGSENYNDAVAMFVQLLTIADKNYSLLENDEDEQERHVFPNDDTASTFLSHCEHKFFSEIATALDSYSKYLSKQELSFVEDEANLSNFVEYLQGIKIKQDNHKDFMTGLMTENV